MKKIIIPLFIFLVFFCEPSYSQNGICVTSECYEIYNGYDSTGTRETVLFTDSGTFLYYENYDYLGNLTTSYGQYSILLGFITNDSLNRIIERNVILFDTLPAKPSSHTTFTYNSNGVMTDSLMLSYTNGNWENNLQWHIEIDSTGRVLYYETDFWYNGTWVAAGRMEWFYDSNGNDTLRVVSHENNLVLQPFEYTRKFFSQFGCTDSMSFSLNGANWVYKNRAQFFYQGLLQDTLDLFFNGNINNWDSSIMIRKTFDVNGDPVVVGKYIYNNGTWKPDTLRLFTYDNLHQAITEIIQLYDSIGWVNKWMNNYSYSTYMGVQTMRWNGSAWDCYSFMDTTGSPTSIQIRGGTYVDCNTPQIDTEIDIDLDSAGNVIGWSSNGHAGSSGGGGIYLYDADGFLYEYWESSTTMGGFTHSNHCYYTRPLLSYVQSLYDVCPGDSIIINASSWGGRPPYRYTWTYNNIQLPDTTPSLNSTALFAEGQYRFTVTDSFNNYFSETINVIIHPNPQLGNDTLICEYGNLLLNPGTFTSYVWQDNSIDSAFLASSTSGVDTIEYYVQVLDSSGCVNSDSITIVYDACLNTNQAEYPEISVYPNPSDGKFVINCNEQVDKLQIQSIDGRIVYETNPPERVIEFNFSPGCYFINVRIRKHTFVKKVIIN